VTNVKTVWTENWSKLSFGDYISVEKSDI